MKKKVIDRQRLDSLYVAFVDKNRTSRRYFRISYFPRYLHAGKNYIGIRGPSKILYPNSMIHSEIIDRAGNPIYHELLDYVHGDGSRVLVVYVYPDTARGAATVYLGGTAREIPEHNKLLSLTAVSNSAKPTHFKYPTRTKVITRIDYNVGTVTDKDFREIEFIDPMTFIDRMSETGKLVETFDGAVDIYVLEDTAPSYYTSFDDEYIIMNAYEKSKEATLQADKTRAWGSTYPTFSQTDSFEPDLDNTLMPLLLAEAKSTCMSLFKGGPDPKIDQAARRLKSLRTKRSV